MQNEIVAKLNRHLAAGIRTEADALCKAGGGIVVAQAGERLDSVEIELLDLDNFLERQIKADGALVDRVFLRRCAEKILQTGL